MVDASAHSLYVTVSHLGPLENCLWVQCLGLPWIVLVGFDPTDVLTSPEAPLPQTLQWQVIRQSSDSLLFRGALKNRGTIKQYHVTFNKYKWR